MKKFTFHYATESGGEDKLQIPASNHGKAKAKFKSQLPTDFVKILKVIKEKTNGKV